ncbi:MAG: glycosyltransferase [Verrucomicrobiota bacterium]
MTAIYSIPKTISSKFRFRSKPVNPHNINVIIPTYKDWDGLRVTLDSLLKLKTPPKKISVVNDNDESGVPEWLKSYQVGVVEYVGNAGPAKARNRGFGLQDDFNQDEVPMDVRLKRWGALFHPERSLPDYIKNGYCKELKYQPYASDPDVFEWESDVNWYYFTDCGCTHDPELFLKFEKAWEECGDSCVAISGPVTGIGNGLINEFMTEQGILNPPLEKTIHGVYIPQAVITANVLVTGLPFAFLGGFDPDFPEAAGEDLDLGIRLREFGLIAWASDARVAHQFAEDEKDFYHRFRRYGRGNRRLEVKHQLPSLRAKKFIAEKPEHQQIANLAVKAMQEGYDEAIVRMERGILKIV